MCVLGQRLEQYGLRLHPDKTRLLALRATAMVSRRERAGQPSTFSGSRSTGVEPE